MGVKESHWLQKKDISVKGVFPENFTQKVWDGLHGNVLLVFNAVKHTLKFSLIGTWLEQGLLKRYEVFVCGCASWCDSSAPTNTSYANQSGENTRQWERRRPGRQRQRALVLWACRNTKGISSFSFVLLDVSRVLLPFSNADTGLFWLLNHLSMQGCKTGPTARFPSFRQVLAVLLKDFWLSWTQNRPLCHFDWLNSMSNKNKPIFSPPEGC